MTRLEKHQRKQFAFSVIFFSIVFILIVYFILTTGIKMLLNTSIFVANLNRPSESAKFANKDNLITDLNVEDLPSATNSSQLIVSGTAPKYKKLYFYINEEKVKEIEPDKDTFSEEIGALQGGKNEIFVEGVLESDQKRKSEVYTVFYKKDKPKLEIKEPQEKTTVNNQEIKITGATDKEVSIKANQFPVVVDSQGNFQTSLRLQEGENKIIIEAQDVAGNIEKKELTVTFTKDQ